MFLCAMIFEILENILVVAWMDISYVDFCVGYIHSGLGFEHVLFLFCLTK